MLGAAVAGGFDGARENFKIFWTMYEPDKCGSPESQVVMAAKGEVARAFDAMQATSNGRIHGSLLLTVRKNLDVLRSEAERRAVEFESEAIEDASQP